MSPGTIQGDATDTAVPAADAPRRPALNCADGVGIRPSVRPGRVRNRNKAEVGETVKKPAEESRKKTPPSTRKAPSRGRYVDEYARRPN